MASERILFGLGGIGWVLLCEIVLQEKKYWKKIKEKKLKEKKKNLFFPWQHNPEVRSWNSDPRADVEFLHGLGWGGFKYGESALNSGK